MQAPVCYRIGEANYFDFDFDFFFGAAAFFFLTIVPPVFFAAFFSAAFEAFACLAAFSRPF